MPIQFDPARWDTIHTDAAAWWAGELDRPLMQVRLRGLDPGRPEPDIPEDRFTTHYDPSISAERVVDRWDYDLSRTKFLGDAFPNIWPNFGAGAVAAFLGADIHNTDDTTWFIPKSVQEIADIQLDYDPAERWFNRAKDICQAAIDRWQGAVQVDMVDLGGTIDVISTFRPSELLLLDLYDSPDEVERLNWQIHENWLRYFAEFNQILQPANRGYTAWTPIFSPEPYYMHQCDFCYMLSPDMFERFVKPQLVAAFQTMPHAFYHLDGPGQLNHLDSFLEIEELKGIQWVPGAGVADEGGWPEVYQKIRAAGKLVQIGVSDGPQMEIFDRIIDQVGSAEGLVWIYKGDISEEDEIMRFLEKYGAA
ncbi:MAG: hypothetical protein QF719_06560 [Chloroflexota bacterium]|jgi:hypothetical protein|nr:hypothetical protein [Chloroflexota bacterium]MDP6508204.1 hypothetical protein [Chloroflexota bacterium]MDP6757860.1 hypothetical protein [Chloroflexota bacterium]